MDIFISERQKWADFYSRHLTDLAWLQLPAMPDDWFMSCQAYVCRYKDNAPFIRNQLLAKLHEKGISTRMGTQAVYILGYYRKKYNLSDEDCIVARDAYNDSIAILLHNATSSDEYENI